MNEIKIRVLTGDLKREEINLNDITREQALAYANEDKIICVCGLSNKGPMFDIGPKHINAIYNSGVLDSQFKLDWAQDFIEAYNLKDFVNLVEAEGEQWISKVKVFACFAYAIDNLPAEMLRYVDYINLEELGEEMAFENGLHVTDNKHVVIIY